jgi:hypothetical protein
MAFTHSAKSIPYYKYEEYEILASNLIRDYDYIFYVSPKGVELEDNGVRAYDAEYRDKIDTSIKDILRKYDHKIKRYVELSGSTQERIETMKQTIFPSYL